MTLENLQLRFKLSAAELHVVFAALSTRRVIGIPNQLIFPADENIANQLYEVGFQRLVSNGWLQPDGKKFNTNNELFLLASVLALPSKTIMVTRGFKEQSQTATYYCRGQLTVEQYFNHENLYCISPLNSVEMVCKNISGFIELPVESQHNISVTVPKDQFVAIMDSDKKLEQLSDLFESQEIASSFVAATPFGEIEWGLINSDKPASIETWAMIKNDVNQQMYGLENKGESVSVFSIDQTSFSKKVANF